MDRTVDAKTLIEDMLRQGDEDDTPPAFRRSGAQNIVVARHVVIHQVFNYFIDSPNREERNHP